ncbi:MAG: CDP-diacylglycerol--glycerol-3-phosphate 3-phosphatidyltransferase [Bacilli bacterium]|nr:CDP-diacylglycerol--glycerol-3-phosphate 3-phosphatidyltransferase [Bacilli bacterium]
MNLPNKITLFRVLMIPIVMVIGELAFLQETYMFNTNFLTTGNFILLILFLVCAFSDFLDGYIARKQNIVTNFGKFADPLADKIVVLALYVILLEQANALAGWMVTLIFAREFIVTGFRVIAASQNINIAAGWLGKIKTNLQFLSIAVLLVFGSMDNQIAQIVILVILYATVLMTIISGTEYIIKNRKVLVDEKE